MKNNEDFTLTITTLFGLEDLLANEVRSLGGRDVKPINRGVQCTGDLGFAYKCNFMLRLAIKVLVPIADIRFRDDESFYKAIKKIDWPSLFSIDKTFAIQVNGQSMMFRNSLYASRKAKDAIADTFREAHDGKRPSVNAKNPQVAISIYLKNHEAEVALNSSGESLHRRGYRVEPGLAPLNEVLAAGIVQATKWNGGKLFFDPMCGSGTFLIEAAMLASNLPAGVFREEFGFTHWKNYDEELFNTIRDGGLKRAIEYEGKIMGRDASSSALEAARENITKAMFDDLITVKKANFATDDAPDKPGILVMNPPYNVKIASQNKKLYSAIGTKLKHDYAGWIAYVFTADLDAVKHIGLKPTWRKKLFNGPLEGVLLRYDMFSGKRKKQFDKN